MTMPAQRQGWHHAAVVRSQVGDHVAPQRAVHTDPVQQDEQFAAGGEIYYLTPGGFLYRRDPGTGTEEVGGYFCGYLTDKVWRYKTNARQNRRQVA